MKRLWVLGVLLWIYLPSGMASQSVQFAALDIYVDSRSDHLAAWQFELNDLNGVMKVVGVENGEHPAFKHVPSYDRDAVSSDHADRIVVASFSLNDTGQLPQGRTRVATVHVQLNGEPEYQIQLVNAGNEQGEPIPAVITLQEK